MSNVLKSGRVLICEEKKYIFNPRRNVIAYPPIKPVSTAEEKQKIEVNLEEIKKQAEKEAEQIINEAEKHANKIIEEAKLEAKAILEKVRSEGYAEGYTEGHEKGLIEGRDKGEMEYQDSINRANAAKEEYERMRETLYQSCEQDMVRLAINIARKIIDARMEDDERIYLRIAEKTLAEIKGQKGIQLRCSSKDYPIAVANKEFLISMLEGVDDINIIEDMFLSKGSCVVETEGGMVDGSIDTQIDKIKNAFKFLLEESTKGVHQ